MLCEELSDAIQALEKALANEPHASALETAKYYGETVSSCMAKLRTASDSLETIIDRSYWPLPSYGEILNSVK